MADVTRESKLKNIKARHQQWMQQRDAEKDRMNVMQEMQEVNMDSGKDQTVEMVDKLTQRITDRLRVEIRNELQSASTTQQLPNKETSIRDKLESFLVQEIQSQTCPICYELMASPERAPILLFPCGHSFCSTCLTAHTQRHKKKKCPCCREAIEFKAPNISLQQLLTNFSAKKEKLSGRIAPRNPQEESDHRQEPNPTTATVNGDDELVERLQRDHFSNAMRLNVIRSESEDVQAELLLLQERHDACLTLTEHLNTEKQGIDKRMCDLKSELSLVTSQIDEQQAKASKCKSDLQDGRTRLKFLNEIADGLCQEQHKIETILDAAKEI